MKKLYYLLLGALPLMSHAQNCNFSDSYFKDALLAASPVNTVAKDLNGNYCKIDANGDGEIQESEAQQISELEIVSASVAYFDGIENFTHLIALNCTNNGRLGTPMGSFKPISLDISGLPSLKRLTAQNDEFYLGIGSFTNLEKLDIFHSRGFSGTLDMTAFTNLKELNCGRINITGLNIDGLSGLEMLSTTFNDISTIDLTGQPNLKYLNISYSMVTSLDVSNHTELEELRCTDSEIASLNISGCTNLKTLYATETWLETLDASNLPQLENLRVQSGVLTGLNISGSSNLVNLFCAYGQLTNLDASNFPNLVTLECQGNLLQQLDVNGSPNIETFNCGTNQLTTLDCREMSHLNYLSCTENPLTELFIKNGSVEETLYITDDLSLDYICADEEQMLYLQAWAANFNPECVIDSNCALLQTTDFAQTEATIIYPNPADHILHIQTDAEISSVKIYNMLGQMVLSSSQNTIDVSSLQRASYLIKINTDNGSTAKRFLKN